MHAAVLASVFITVCLNTHTLSLPPAFPMSFVGRPPKHGRFVFARAYAEVWYVLETNLMTRFVSSEGFEAARQQHDQLTRRAEESRARSQALLERNKSFVAAGFFSN